MKKKIGFLLLNIFLIVGLFAQIALADGPLTNARFEEVGNYSLVAAGVGLHDLTSGTITLDVPGTVIQAFLYWTGYDFSSSGGDDTIYLSVDGGVAQELTADTTYGPDPWYDGNYHYVYVKTITSYVLEDSHTYSLSDVEVGYNHGAGIIAVYEDSMLPLSLVKIYDGLDSFHYGFAPPQGPNSEVTSIDFSACGINRDMDVLLFVGGIQHNDRPNSIWYQTGTDTKPTTLVDESAATELEIPPPYPLTAADGAMWDTYTNSIPVEMGDTWTCIQIESIVSAGSPPPGYEGKGCSGLLLCAGFVLPVCQPPPGVGTPGYWKNHPEAWPEEEITVGGVTYSRDDAIAHLKTPEKGDKTFTMFRALVAAKLNIAIGNPSGCISDTITSADDWMAAYGPVGSGVSGSSEAWGIGEPFADTLDDYNNGLMCAPHRD